MYEKMVDAVVKNVRQVSRNMSTVETINLFKAFPTRVTQADASQIWSLVIDKLGRQKNATQSCDKDRHRHFLQPYNQNQ